MAKNFRAVKTIWGTSSGCFLKPDVLEMLLVSLAEAAFAGKVEVEAHNNVTEVWIEEAEQFFAYIESKTNEFLLNNQFPEKTDETVEQIINALDALNNIRNLMYEWKQLIDTDGSIRFYIDAF